MIAPNPESPQESGLNQLSVVIWMFFLPEQELNLYHGAGYSLIIGRRKYGNSMNTVLFF